MELQELLKKVRQIEFKTKKLSKELFSGNYASTFKGRGMSFSEVRAYTYGDDIRNIDWNVTSRSGEPFVKEYEEERELTFMLLIDISSSMDFGSMQRKRDFVAEIAATLAFSSLKNNDKVGVLFFTERIENHTLENQEITQEKIYSIFQKTTAHLGNNDLINAKKTLIALGIVTTIFGMKQKDKDLVMLFTILI
jgi:hypothetical protein